MKTRELSDEIKFNGKSGRKPQTEARRYVYAVLVSMIEADIGTYPSSVEGWMYGGITNEFDRRRLKKALVAVQNELQRKVAKQ